MSTQNRNALRWQLKLTPCLFRSLIALWTQGPNLKGSQKKWDSDVLGTEVAK